jgi:hypothetical protein
MNMLRGTWSDVGLASGDERFSPQREDRPHEQREENSSPESSAPFHQVPLKMDKRQERPSMSSLFQTNLKKRKTE